MFHLINSLARTSCQTGLTLNLNYNPWKIKFSSASASSLSLTHTRARTHTHAHTHTHVRARARKRERASFTGKSMLLVKCDHRRLLISFSPIQCLENRFRLLMYLTVVAFRGLPVQNESECHGSTSKTKTKQKQKN